MIGALALKVAGRIEKTKIDVKIKIRVPVLCMLYLYQLFRFAANKVGQLTIRPGGSVELRVFHGVFVNIIRVKTSVPTRFHIRAKNKRVCRRAKVAKVNICIGYGVS